MLSNHMIGMINEFVKNNQEELNRMRDFHKFEFIERIIRPYYREMTQLEILDSKNYIAEITGDKDESYGESTYKHCTD